MDSLLVHKTSILYPTAIEAADLHSSTVSTTHPCQPQQGSPSDQSHASDSCVNRCDRHTWRVDGSIDGTRFFVVPDIALRAPPLKIDVYISQLDHLPANLLPRDEDLNHAHDLASDLNGDCLVSTAADSLVCVLSRWSAQLKSFSEDYFQLPYGSYIVVGNNVDMNDPSIELSMVPDLTTERAWLSLNALERMWQFGPEMWPQALDWAQLRLHSQPHDTISLVTLGIDDGELRGRVFVYKSVLRDLQHFYHELKVLLSMPSHPNIIARPRFIVTKKARFGGKHGVCGMILEYHPGGTLYDKLLRPLQDHTHHIRQCVNLARQIVSALIHIRDTLGFYANLKPHNIMLTVQRRKYRPVIIDFEQRCGWYAWSAPEIHYVNYLEHLATYSKNSSRRDYYTKLLQGYMPNWTPLDMKARYNNPGDGYAAPWSALTSDERVAAQVFMLGKLLWCIFESAHGTSSCLTPESLREPACESQFPTFSLTPDLLRTCIRRCTAGAPEWSGCWPAVIKKGDRIYQYGNVDTVNTDVVVIQRAAKQWWHEQIKQSERFIVARTRIRNNQEHFLAEDHKACAFMMDRPSLESVLETLSRVEREAQSTEHDEFDC